jgi:hypothetical protein
MLMRAPAKGSDKQHTPRRVRQLWHDEKRNAPALGCETCPEKLACGGLRISAPFFDCLTYCCGKPHDCHTTCRANVDYAKRVLEIDSFDLENCPRGPKLLAPPLPLVVPIIYHGSSRVGLSTPSIAALPLGAMFSRRDGDPKFISAPGLREKYRLDPTSRLIITGTGEDEPIERWWSLGVSKRRRILQHLKGAGIEFMTTPNYSLTINVPRWDDLYAIKRIALCYAEMIGEGISTALHVNGRTDTDFKRWSDFISERNEITHVAYEFTTGSGYWTRRRQHATWLCNLSHAVGRPLHLVVRGGHDLLPGLNAAFAGVTLLEADSFMWTVNRQKAIRLGNSSIRHRTAPTDKGAPLDDLFAHNLRTNKEYFEGILAKSTENSNFIDR